MVTRQNTMIAMLFQTVKHGEFSNKNRNPCQHFVVDVINMDLETNLWIDLVADPEAGSVIPDAAAVFREIHAGGA